MYAVPGLYTRYVTHICAQRTRGILSAVHFLIATFAALKMKRRDRRGSAVIIIVFFVRGEYFSLAADRAE